MATEPAPEELEQEAQDIENRAAQRSYDCGFGVCEWDSFVLDHDYDRLKELALMGYGTWGREKKFT